ncbi:MAG: DNA polymerase I [Bacteroidia bacterium]|jgi:DNA polymerase-1|nr:DNA polymerase I [Bacteroidia bacterium]
MSQTRPKLFLLDAMALIYRAYFAMNKNPRINSKGFNTSAILGFANTLYDIIRNEKPTHLGVAFDTMAPTQRHTDFADYKANREKMPDDIEKAIPFVIELVKAFNIPVLMAEGFEADDVIGTLAKTAEKQGFITYMMTPDKDFGQLVTENILMYKPARAGDAAEVWGVAEVCARYGIERPEQVIDILGLMGDASDNIPGIPGVGEKTAIKLIQEFGSMENLLANTHQLKGKLKEYVEQFASQGLQSKQLATIITDAPVPFEPENLKMGRPDYEKLKALFDELEFRTFAKRVFSEMQPATGDLFGELPEDEQGREAGARKTIATVDHHYELVEGSEAVKLLMAELLKHNTVSFDTETTALDAHTAELVGLSFAVRPHHAWYVPMPDNYHQCQQMLELFRPFFTNSQILKVGQNMKYDISVLRWYDMTVAGPLFDTMIAHYLIEPEQRHSMDYMAETLLNYSPVPIENLIGKKGKDQGSMRDVPLEQIKEYAAEDADITLQLYHKLAPGLEAGGLEKLMHNIEMPLVNVLADMEAEGVKLDISTLKEIGAQMQSEIVQLEAEIHALAGSAFNIASPKQLGEVLFEKLGLSTSAKKTKTGQYPTGEEVLSRLVHEHPIIEKILDYRQLTKLKSTYVDALPALVNPRDGRVHTSYNQAVAATGRLSSNNPNLQNIPIRTDRGREIRKAFVPRNKSFTLLAADYSQIELRIIAHLSGDKGMIEAFNTGHDIHAATASRVYGIPIDQVTKEMRRNAKTVNFGIIYGISAFGLSERLGIARGEASKIIASYFREYQGIKEYMSRQIEFARKHGYVETMLGRRRYLRDINSANSVVRSFAERNAINAPIQGSSADMIKLAMINIQAEMKKLGMQSKMILQVHDELVFDAHMDELETLKPLVASYMRDALPLSVPVVVEMNTGNNWLEAH